MSIRGGRWLCFGTPKLAWCVVPAYLDSLHLSEKNFKFCTGIPLGYCSRLIIFPYCCRHYVAIIMLFMHAVAIRHHIVSNFDHERLLGIPLPKLLQITITLCRYLFVTSTLKLFPLITYRIFIVFANMPVTEIRPWFSILLKGMALFFFFWSDTKAPHLSTSQEVIPMIWMEISDRSCNIWHSRLEL